MFSEYEPKYARIEYAPVVILVVIFAAIIFMTICALSIMLLNQQRVFHPTLEQDNLMMAPLPVTTAANQFSIHLPIILSESVSVPSQIWKVTKVIKDGYELDGQRNDLATFTHIDGQDTLQGYCINRGWDIPDIGTEYLLDAGGIFVPLYEQDAHPLQRFLTIQE